ncbi:MAG: hypothetical protein QOJ03_2411 [Frankiaceae bacterium]|jgi:prepilin-type N-terminal cleavage/methylation domain-containing protein|nr:hypothetical protein [Frankiaceae bacterium]
MSVTRRAKADSGFSLIELLIVVTLLGTVGGIIGTAMISGMRTTRQLQNRATSADDVQQLLERMARDIRVADPIRAASANSITVDLYRGNTCLRQQWTVTSGSVVSTAKTYSSWAACAVYPGTATPTATVTTTVLPSLGNGATSLFTYQDQTGNTLANPLPNQIGVVHVTLIQTGKEGRAGVTFDTSVGVRNEALG